MAVKPMIKNLRQQGTPSILNISSVLSLTGLTTPGTTLYAALKAGILGFTESLAAELNGKVRVNAVLPGLVTETDMGKNATVGGKFPIVSLEEVVDSCVEVICDETLNGQYILADGKGFRSLNVSGY